MKGTGMTGTPRLLKKKRYKDIALKTGVVANFRLGVKHKRALQRTTVSCILRGVHKYSQDSLTRIARALDVSPGWLANWIEANKKET